MKYNNQKKSLEALFTQYVTESATLLAEIETAKTTEATMKTDFTTAVTEAGTAGLGDADWGTTGAPTVSEVFDVCNNFDMNEFKMSALPDDLSKWGEGITATTFKSLDKVIGDFDVCKAPESPE